MSVFCVDAQSAAWVALTGARRTLASPDVQEHFGWAGSKDSAHGQLRVSLHFIGMRILINV